MRNDGYDYPDRISRSDERSSVLSFYARRYRHSTEAEWREKIVRGEVTLNGRPASPDDALSACDLLIYHRPPWDEPDAPTDFGVLFEDDDVLALAKPSGLPVLPGGFFLETTLLRLARRRFGPSVSPLHRLGRGTSGTILFIRNHRAGRLLAKAMFERRILKVYLALASGTALPDSFTVDAPIGPVPHRRPATVNAFRSDGRPSTSHVRVLQRLPDRDASLVEVTIPTGRPHQIRIHLACAGHPLVGDPLYLPGGLLRSDGLDDEWTTTPGATGYLLHSWRIRFPHPSRGEDVDVVSPPPAALDPDRRTDQGS
ncbi:MAG TPA: RluA family pseudouridine synthase [Candidatus Aminicenantes bacterium]|nr:RluA family pseudouridine synthase [Candidatus Aminicenantes bacterium]HRY63862.1 RluA family pseudouridine synthase [Candidatus Aminicenantes bacterium]HRZ70775.1 RluA family pseudouridine synthase [Candidatus Aminicenantes bacterium]